MGQTSKGVIQFKGNRGNDPGHTHKMTISNPIDAIALGTFQTYLTASITDCVSPKSSFTETTTVSVGPIAGDVNVDVLAIFVLEDLDTGGIIKTAVPSPLSGIVEATPDGDRISEAAVTGFAGAYATMTGKTLNGLYGYVIQRR